MRAVLPGERCAALPGSASEAGALIARRCSRPDASRTLYTLTYVYRDSTAVLGPLAAYMEPHCYDLCAPMRAG